MVLVSLQTLIREISALVLLEIDLKLVRITTRKALQTDSVMIPETSMIRPLFMLS